MNKPDFSTSESCREYIGAFRLDGEKVGFLVSMKTGVEVADYSALRGCAEGLWLQYQDSVKAELN